MNTPEEIFDFALTRLLSGESIDAITTDYPEYKQELVGLLAIAELGMNIPKLEVPRPYKRHLYAEKITMSARLWEIVRFSRVAVVPIALVVALIGGGSVVNAAKTSLPGSPFYTLKRATENARLAITRNPEKLAVIHVELMQNRIDEVRQAAQAGNQEAETAAVAELQSQTAKTFAEVTPVATANAISKQDSTLLNTLVAVSKQQKDVLQDLQQRDDTSKTVATTALDDNKKNDQALAKIIATVNDQTLTDLNKISVTGNITNHVGSTILVEKNLFTIDDKTVITGVDGQVTTDLKALTGRASVTGLKMSNGSIVAKQILLLADDGTVKGATDTKTPAVKPTPKPVETTKPVTPPTEPVDNSNTNTSPTPPTTQASGSFIAEPATQQYGN